MLGITCLICLGRKVERVSDDSGRRVNGRESRVCFDVSILFSLIECIK